MSQQKSDHAPTRAVPHLVGAEHMTADDVRWWLRNGAVAVRYEYCISVGLASLSCRSRLHLIDTKSRRYIPGLPYSLLSLALGPWGLPWGPVLAARAIWSNFSGGVDATAEAEALLAAEPAESP